MVQSACHFVALTMWYMDINKANMSMHFIYPFTFLFLLQPLSGS